MRMFFTMPAMAGPVKSRHRVEWLMTKFVSSNVEVPPLLSGGVPLNTGPDVFGLLNNSSDAIDSTDELRERMRRDGYLFLPGYLNRDEVLEARREVTRRLAEQGCLEDRSDPMDSVARKDYT